MKNFNDWINNKKSLEEKTRNFPIFLFHKSEIWWTSIGINLGDEEDGKNEKFERPVLVIRKFSKDLFIGIPLSTKIKNGEFYLNFKSDKLEYSVLLSQARVLSSKRLLRKISKLSRGKLKLVLDSYTRLLYM